ncbi:MAG: tRNA (adenosine(37)-N6)-threonylcarbamoyltransferase complex ATPase subunit type 1 TsaE [Candidatus Dadabacteria bacterium]|nr:tRNA (adenosine(37)-N6)-threonylcarbamoyltransferase complex ATPase subunit type 1 TsaE [Candidatus Dadabacteria bacterium]
MSGQTTITTSSERETEQVGRRLATQLKSGSTVLLYGGLGAGKTVLARGIARGLGVDEVVSSPTFVIMNRYETTEGTPLFHFDLYRNPSAGEFGGLGFEEILSGEGIAVIEWAENLPPGLVENPVTVRLRASGDSGRTLEISGALLTE